MRQKPKRFMNKIHILEISTVDQPAQEHARIMITKRRDEAIAKTAMLETVGELQFHHQLKKDLTALLKSADPAKCRQARKTLRALGKGWMDSNWPELTDEERERLIGIHAAEEEDEEIARRASDKDYAGMKADDIETETEENDDMDEDAVNVTEQQVISAVAKVYQCGTTQAMRAYAKAEEGDTLDELLEPCWAELENMVNNAAVRDQVAKRAKERAEKRARGAVVVRNVWEARAHNSERRHEMAKRGLGPRCTELRRQLEENPEAFGYERA